MTLLPLLQALKKRKQQGQDCEELLRELERGLERFRGSMRRMVFGQLAEEDAILNTALSSIFDAIEGFRGKTEAEGVSYCRRVVTRKTLDHIRRERGRLVYVGRETSRTSGYEQDPDEEATGGEEGPEAIPQQERSDPETLVSRKETWQLVRTALASLSPQEQELVKRVELHGERITDIARKMMELQRDSASLADEERALRRLENQLTQRKDRALLKLRKRLPADLKEQVR